MDSYRKCWFESGRCKNLCLGQIRYKNVVFWKSLSKSRQFIFYFSCLGVRNILFSRKSCESRQTIQPNSHHSGLFLGKPHGIWRLLYCVQTIMFACLQLCTGKAQHLQHFPTMEGSNEDVLTELCQRSWKKERIEQWWKAQVIIMYLMSLSDWTIPCPCS